MKPKLRTHLYRQLSCFECRLDHLLFGRLFGLSCFFLNRKLHLLVDVDQTKLPSLSFGIRVLVVVMLPLGTVSDTVHTSTLWPSVQREALHYVQGPVEMG